MKAYTVLSLTLAVQTCGLTILTLGLAALTCEQALLASLVLLELGCSHDVQVLTPLDNYNKFSLHLFVQLNFEIVYNLHLYSCLNSELIHPNNYMSVPLRCLSAVLNIVMSDLEDSTVTYTMAPPSLNYVTGPKEPEQAPPLPEFVPEPVYLEFMPLEDDVLPAEEQLLPAAASPTTDSPGYIPKSGLEEDDDEDPEEDPTDYPTDRDDDEEEEEEEPSGDEADDEECGRGTNDEISIPAQAPIPFLSEEEVERFLVIPTPPPSPLTTLSSPLPHIPSLPLQVAMIRLRAETPSTSHPLPSITPPSGTPLLLPIPLPTSSPPLLLPYTDRRADRPKVCLPPRKRLCITLGMRYEVGESLSALTDRPTGGFRVDYGFVATLNDEIRRNPKRDVGYGITNTWDEMLVGMSGAPATNDTELGRRMTNFRDRRSYAYTALLMEREVRLFHEAWGQSMDASNTARSKMRALWTTTQVTKLQSQQGPTSGPT
ncbi:hypothetical protein Tco_0462547 [Tanacetum coccineum]